MAARGVSVSAGPAATSARVCSLFFAFMLDGGESEFAM